MTLFGLQCICHAFVQVLQESLSIPGTDIYLVYRSSQTSGYMSTILIQLTPDHIPEDLAIVHLRVVVEGLVFERQFEADPELRYRFTWDRRNAYNQKVYGIVTANGEIDTQMFSVLYKTTVFIYFCFKVAGDRTGNYPHIPRPLETRCH